MNNNTKQKFERSGSFFLRETITYSKYTTSVANREDQKFLINIMKPDIQKYRSYAVYNVVVRRMARVHTLLSTRVFNFFILDI